MRNASAAPLPRWRTDVFLAAAIALDLATRGILPVVLPAMRAEFHYSDAAFGILGSLFFWSYSAFAPVAGALGDLYSRRLVILVSLVAWSASTALNGAATGFITLAVLRLAFGFSESLYLPAATALQADHHEPETRTLAMGLNSLAQNGGAVLGAAGAGLIAEHWGWRYAFAAFGLAGIVLALCSGHLLRDAPVSTTVQAPRTNIREALAYLLRDPTYLLLDANEILSAVAVWIFFFWLPLFLYETYGIKMAAAGFSGMAMQQFSGMAGIAAGTWLSRRLPHLDARRRLSVFAICYVAAAPCLLCFLFHPTFLAVVIAVSIFSLLRGLGAVYELPVLCDGSSRILMGEIMIQPA